jgi:predicted DsbA family dithiol-disulfide isomerase
MSEPVRVQIWFDVQCVWCYFGDARWRDAIAQFDGAVEVTHRSFELQPGFPIDFDAQEYLASTRGIDTDAQQRAFDGMRLVASRAGLPYSPERIRPTNSYLALQLLHYAGTVERHDATLDRLFAAYFVEGRHIGTVDSLVELGAEAGLDAHGVRTALETGAFADAVDADTAKAAALGVRGVPFAVVNGIYAVPGALETPQLLDLLRQAAA